MLFIMANYYIRSINLSGQGKSFFGTIIKCLYISGNISLQFMDITTRWVEVRQQKNIKTIDEPFEQEILDRIVDNGNSLNVKYLLHLITALGMAHTSTHLYDDKDLTYGNASQGSTELCGKICMMNPTIQKKALHGFGL